MSPAKRIVRRPRPKGRLGLSPVLDPILLARGIEERGELAFSLERLPDPFALSGMERAVLRLEQALRGRERVVVVADYDVDGATACAVALLGLRALGFEQLGFIVPDRARHGYGLTPLLVREVAAKRPDLLLTVDSGISDIGGVAAARAHGIDVIITDHHLPGKELPKATAILNPRLEGDPFPGKALSGVGVVFYLLIALRAHLRERGYFKGREVPNLAELLDLVALGTVADVVPLDRINRILVAQGLRRIRAGRCRPGISALVRLSRRELRWLTTADLAFAVAPKLNAAGRLDDMTVGIRCLLASDPARAEALARRLVKLNRSRQEIEAGMVETALARLPSPCDHGVCLFDESWHEGIVGILAGRIRDRLRVPAAAFAPSGELLKGSVRSLPGLHIRDLLQEISVEEPGLIARFGGHAQAAGLSLHREHLPRFAERFQELSAERLEGLCRQELLLSDGELPEEHLTLELAKKLSSLPWGKDFPEPLFDGPFEVLAARPVGADHLRFKLRPLGGKQVLEAVAFRLERRDFWQRQARIRAAYRLALSSWRGLNLELRLEHLEAV